MKTYTSLPRIEEELIYLNVKVVTSETIKKLYPDKSTNTLRGIIRRLLKQGRIGRLKKGQYELKTNPLSTFEKANVLYSPSYISLESALNFYGILPQFPHVITSVTPLHSKKIQLEQTYEYSRIQSELYTDFVKEERFLIATPEKALADMLYFASKGLRKVNIDEYDFSQIDLKSMTEKYPWVKNYVKR